MLRNQSYENQTARSAAVGCDGPIHPSALAEINSRLQDLYERTVNCNRTALDTADRVFGSVPEKETSSPCGRAVNGGVDAIHGQIDLLGDALAFLESQLSRLSRL